MNHPQYSRAENYENILLVSWVFIFYYTGRKYFWALLHLYKLTLQNCILTKIYNPNFTIYISVQIVTLLIS